MHHLDSWIKRDLLDVICFIISLFNVQHVSDVNASILRSWRLICWVISRVVLSWFDVCLCYVVVWLGWCGIRMQAEALVGLSLFNNGTVSFKFVTYFLLPAATCFLVLRSYDAIITAGRAQWCPGNTRYTHLNSTCTGCGWYRTLRTWYYFLQRSVSGFPEYQIPD